GPGTAFSLPFWGGGKAREAGLRSCENIPACDPARMIRVPHLRRSVCGPLKPRAHARGYYCTASSRLDWKSLEALRFHQLGKKPGAKRRKYVATRVSAWFRARNGIEARGAGTPE
ncbi:MAG TPA: hypothetical protein VF888_02210, partial [Nitrospirota bacterium]